MHIHSNTICDMFNQFRWPLYLVMKFILLYSPLKERRDFIETVLIPWLRYIGFHIWLSNLSHSRSIEGNVVKDDGMEREALLRKTFHVARSNETRI